MAHDNEIKDFLHRVDRLVEPALLFGTGIDVEHLHTLVETVFDGRHVFTLRAHGPLPPSESDVTETIRNSFDGHGVLLVMMGASTPPAVIRAISRLCADGAFSERKDGGAWVRHAPPPSWRMVVLADAATPDDLPPELADAFPAVMAL
ncbi:MAG: hypothetical protein EB084_04500 [Proteobacteria bacterium]|nr:hypothetical protein [Pseudomonadota bacterium]